MEYAVHLHIQRKSCSCGSVEVEVGYPFTRLPLGVEHPTARLSLGVGHPIYSHPQGAGLLFIDYLLWVVEVWGTLFSSATYAM